VSTLYQIKLLNDAYAELCELDAWQGLHFTQVLSAVGYAEIKISPGDAKIIAYGDTMRRIAIWRDGLQVFGGIVLRVGWQTGQTAPVGDVYSLYALDHAAYAAWRIIVPAAGQEYDSRTDHLDDALKAWVYNQGGAGTTVAARKFSDLTVAADAHAVTSTTIKARYENLLTCLQKYAAGAVDWRFVPGAAGCTFTTAALWGKDRTIGNGVNLECVLTTDRENVLSMTWTKDVLSHRNYVYAGGSGEGINRTIVERSTAGDITAYKRREQFIDARQLTVTADLNTRGDAALNDAKAIITMDALPRPELWQATSGATFDLGDKITVQSKRYTTFSFNGKVIALDVTVTPAGTNVNEAVKPTLEAC